jgi:hypothetical protein
LHGRTKLIILVLPYRCAASTTPPTTGSALAPGITGCENSLNVSHPCVLKLIMDSLLVEMPGEDVYLKRSAPL